MICFAFGLKDLGVLKGQEVRINLTGDAPIYCKPCKYSEVERMMIQDRTKELLEAELVELAPSDCEYASATVMPSKKDIFGNWTKKRMCGDYRRINRFTKSDRYVMPTPEENFDAIGHAKVFSTLDLRSGYHQLGICEGDKGKTAFWGIDEDGKDRLYQWRFLPFGLKNAPAEFQKVMDRIFSGLDFVKCYIDDIIVYNMNQIQHRAHLKEVFARLRLHGLKLHPNKCKFYYDRVEYLGHMIYPGGLGVVASKVEVMISIPRPKDVSRLRAFLGLCNYYRKFVKTFSAIAKPLTLLTRNDQPWMWGDEQEAAFVQLKERLSLAPILRRLISGRTYQLHTDWSSLGIGAVLTQMDDLGKEFVVAYASRSNNNAEAQYSSYESECLAAIWAIAHFHCYLYGNKFLLVTDHQPLKWLIESDKLTGKLARWALMLMGYDFKVVHRAGLVNMDADGLRCNPSLSQVDSTGPRWHMEEGEDSLPGWHSATYLSLLAMNGDVTKEAIVATVDADGGEEFGGAKDIFEDEDVMKYLKHGELATTMSAKEKDRIQQRAKRFMWEGDHLLQVWPDGNKKVVPVPLERVKVIMHAHEDLGHFGVHKTHSLLQIHYWWRGMQTQVQQLVARCMVCDKVRASFNAPMPQLQPLPNHGIGLPVEFRLCRTITTNITT